MRAFEPAGEIPSEVEGALRIVRIRPFSHAVSGNSLDHFVLENPFVDNEIAGVGRTPWRSMGERHGVGILRLALPFRKLRVVLAQEDRGIPYFSQTEALPKSSIRTIF